MTAEDVLHQTLKAVMDWKTCSCYVSCPGSSEKGGVVLFELRHPTTAQMTNGVVTEEVTRLLHTLCQVVPRTPMTSRAVWPQTVEAVMKRNPSLNSEATRFNGDESNLEDGPMMSTS